MLEIGDSLWITDSHNDIFWEARVVGRRGPWLLISTGEGIPPLIYVPSTGQTKAGLYHSVTKPEPREGILIYPYRKTNRKAASREEGR